MSDWLLRPRAAVRELAPYTLPPAPAELTLRLHANENTAGCSPAVLAALRQSLCAPGLAAYPDYEPAQREIAAAFGVAPAEMLLTNGGDEAIQLLFQTYVDPGDQVILLRPSYAMYRFYAGLAAAEVCGLDYDRPGFVFPLAALLAAIRPTTRAILLANPNNPTGGCIGSAAIECILRAAPEAAVLIDEAYFDFCGTTVLPLLAAYPNLFVCRTFSKAHGLAALRLGCLFSQAGNIALLRRAQPPYSVNLGALVAARASLRDPAYRQAYVEEVRAARTLAAAGLRALGFRVHAGCANFLLFEARRRAPALGAALAARGILLRDCGRDIPGALRLSIGTRSQMATFLSELRAL